MQLSAIWGIRDRFGDAFMTSVEAFEASVVSEIGLGAPLDHRHVLDALPTPVYTTDGEGVVTYFNAAAAELAGREPRVGIDRWCVSWRLHYPDGRPLPLDQCPMAIALKERRPVRGVEIVVERPNGERVPGLPYPTPLFDADGRFVGAINLIVDLSRQRDAELRVARHAAEQAALYRFTDRLYRADGPAAIYEAALDSILEALGCDRASVLLFDDAGVMRFVAARGLSEDYQRAVDGHSPWRPGDEDPEPIFIEDIETSDQPDAIKQVVKREGITALAFIPVVIDRRVIGKFMTYHDNAHSFSAAEGDLSVTIARQLGFAIERQRIEDARQAAEAGFLRSSERLRMATEAGKVGFWDWDVETDQIAWTESLYALHGIDHQEAQTFANWLDRVHPEDRPRVTSAIDRALRNEAPYELEMRTIRPDGGETWLYANAVVVRENDKPVRMVGTAVDVTARRQSEVERDLLVAELSHRVKNTLATVVSIARQSFSRDATLETARQSFEGRLRALAQTHTRLAEASWVSVELATLLSDELAPYRSDGHANVALSGPAVSLTSRQAVILGMAFHELATNAAKYGALSVPSGKVDVRWSNAGGLLVVDWTETGGPPVEAPQRSGFGRLLLERALAADLRGSVALAFPRSGVACQITLPLEQSARPGQ
jgi:PAS domain S-box-containing protein